MSMRNPTRATALGLSMTMSLLAIAPGCTDDDPPEQSGDPQPLSNPSDPIVIGDGSESTEPASIEFRFEPVLIEDGRVFETVELIPEFGASATWDPETLDEADPSTYPTSAIAFSVRIRDLDGHTILESTPHQFYPTDFNVPEDGDLPSPFASASWTYYALTGCAYDIDPTEEGAAAWLEQLEGFLFQIVSTDWDTIAEPTPDPVPVDPTPADPIEIAVDDGQLTAEGHVREIPDHDATLGELLFVCWDSMNEAWHWWKIFKEKCYKGQPPKFELSVDCGWAISGMTNKWIQAAACGYMLADKLGIIPTNETVKKILRTLLVSYALTGKPENVPKLPPPPGIIKKK